MRAEGALRDAIEDFTRNSLGCDCPPEVFRHINYDRAPEAPDGFKPVARLDIGGRLLVYVTEAAAGAGHPNNKTLSSATLNEITKAGIEDRDRGGFNRFRLVIACPKPEKSLREGFLSNLFRDGPGGDDPKAHLHVVSQDDLRLKAVVGSF